MPKPEKKTTVGPRGACHHDFREEAGPTAIAAQILDEGPSSIGEQPEELAQGELLEHIRRPVN
jgi:hypothetical protein